MEKNSRFDAVIVGQEFVLRDMAEQAMVFGTMTEQNANVVLVKKTNSSAYRKDLGEKASKSISIRACAPVAIILPDPTPEELAAKAAEQQAWTEKWYRRRLANEIDACEGKIKQFAERLAANPFDAFEWGTDHAIAAGKLRAFKVLAEVFDVKGYEAAKNYALRMTVQGAKNPQHSTAALSNLVHESLTAGYAEFVIYGD